MRILRRAAYSSRRNAAFTLTELLMVLGIAVVVFALLAAALGNGLHKARLRDSRKDAKTREKARTFEIE